MILPMRNTITCFLTSCLAAWAGLAQAQKDYTQYVNPFVGTGAHGHTYPGASMPSGMMQLSPDTRNDDSWDGCSGYHYSDSVIYGFSHTHLSGTGCPDYGDVLLMPVTRKTGVKDYAYKSSFSHMQESASPGYYEVFLKQPQVQARMTVTERCGMHEYTYPAKAMQGLVLDLKHRDKVLDSKLEMVDAYTLRGYRFSKAWATNQKVFFEIRFSKPVVEQQLFLDDKERKANMLRGNNVKAFFRFASDSAPLKVIVSISGVDERGAAGNLHGEMNDWNFEKFRKAANQKWNKELSKIEAEGGTLEQMRNFYTALYHVYLTPNLYNDVDGRYRGRDDQTHELTGKGNYYTVFSLWDTYRGLHPLLNVLEPERSSDYINTFLLQYRQGKRLPVWELSANETNCMIGNHAIPVIYDAFVKGVGGFDPNQALDAMVSAAMGNEFGLPSYRKNGVVLADEEHESVSKTLEYAFDDWCIAMMAQKLGRKDVYNTFIKRAQSYKNVFDPVTGFMRARWNGGWFTPFDPSEVNNHFTEANSWQYSFYVPQDIDGWIKLMGGKPKALARLDELFSTSSQTSGREQADITGLIGQYAHGNEPSHHMTYLYTYLNQPWKTQYYVHKIMDSMYSSLPEGLIGNEDCGQMSAWYVWSALGMYPVCPGSTQFAIGTPLFPKVTVHLPNKKDWVVTANNRTTDNYYIQGALLNKQPYNKAYIDYKAIANGGYLTFNMGAKANQDWASQEVNGPSTGIFDQLIIPNPVIRTAGRSFKKEMTVTIDCMVPNVTIYYTLDGSEPGMNGIRYSAPFSIDKSCTVKTIAVKNGVSSFPVSASLNRMPNDDWKVDLRSQYNRQYTAGGPDGLIDGIRGNTNWRIGFWQGFQGQDFEAVIDLQRTREVGSITTGFLQDQRAWILMPVSVDFYAAGDDMQFKKIGTQRTSVADKDETVQIKDLVQPVGDNVFARYIKVVAHNYGQLPAWHQGAGGQAFIFVDEIEVK
jgi:predicted alpha-1,2-mannosidase